jgi:hypothetical protein
MVGLLTASVTKLEAQCRAVLCRADQTPWRVSRSAKNGCATRLELGRFGSHSDKFFCGGWVDTDRGIEVRLGRAAIERHR